MKARLEQGKIKQEQTRYLWNTGCIYFSVTPHMGKLLNFGRFICIEEESVSFRFQHFISICVRL